MSRIIPDQTGQKSGMLTVIERVERPKGKRGTWYRCKCECGNDQFLCIGSYIYHRLYGSCGCARKCRGYSRRQEVKESTAHVFDPNNPDKIIPLSFSREQAITSYGVCDGFFNLF